MKNLYLALFIFIVLLPAMSQAQRPTLTNEQTYDSDHFKFHYTIDASSPDVVDTVDTYPQNGIPDDIETISFFLEMFYYPQFHEQGFSEYSLKPWGFNKPPSDGTQGGDDRYDIYMKSFSSARGYCYPDAFANTTDYSMSSYICLNSSLSFNDIYATVAHEYMHAVQMGYGDMPWWFQECAANWGVANTGFTGPIDVVFDLANHFNKTDVAVNYQNSELSGQFEDHHYAMWLFMQYLTEQTDNSLIKNLYERVAQMPARPGRTRIGQVVHGEMTALIDEELKENWNSSLNEMMIKYAVANLIMEDDDIFQPYNYSVAQIVKQYALNDVEPVFENAAPLHFSGTDITWNSQTDGNGRLMRLSYDCLELTADKNFRITISPVPDADTAALVLVKTKKEFQTYGFISEWVTTDAEVVISKSGEIVVDDNAGWTHIYPMVVRTDQSILPEDQNLDYELKITEYIPAADVHSLTFNMRDQSGEVLNHAVVTLNGNEYSYSSGNIKINNLADGTYSYSVKADGFIPQSGTVIINGNNKVVDLFMTGNADIAVKYGNTKLANGALFYTNMFGENDILAEVEEQTLNIYNEGGVALIISDVNLSGQYAPDFTIISSPTVPIAPGDSATLKIQFDPSGIGNRYAVLSISTNDPDANLFMLYIDGDGVSIPVARLEGNNINIPAEKNSISQEDGTDFGNVDITSQYVDRTFTIKNTGSANHENCKIELNSYKEFSIIEQPDTTILPGDSTTFTLRYDPETTGSDLVRVYIRGNIKSPGYYGFYFAVGGTGIDATVGYPEMSVKGNGIIIANKDNTPSVNDDTFFGTTDVSNGYIDKTFTIENTGVASLSMKMSPIVQKVNSKDNLYFSFLSPPPSQIAPGSSSTFTVRFQPAETGIHNARVLLIYNIIGQTYYFQLQGMATNGSEIVVEGNGTEINNGDDTPDIADNTDFGPVEIVNGTVEKTFIIKNTGTNDLDVSVPVISGENNSCFTLVTPPSSVVSPGVSTSFTIGFAADLTGEKTANVSIENTDADEDPFTFAIQGTGILKNNPEIIVEGNSVEIANESTTISVTDNTDFGNVTASIPEIIKSFTIKNSGTSDLYVSTPHIFNDTSGCFTVVSQPAGVVSPNGQTTFDVSYKPATSGIHGATVSIPNNDTDESVYVFAVQGSNNNSGYSLTFNITDGTNPVENAMVTFNGVSYTSDANGGVEIQNLADGNYSYTVSATGYWPQSGNTTISGGDNTENITLYEQIFVVTFYDWDNSTLKQVTAKYNEAASAPDDPERTGYTFTGWDKDISTITSDLTVTAQYTINTYTVIFEDHDGTELKKETVEYGNAATAPAAPSRLGYTFTGWNTDFSNITSNLTIIAQYSINSYTVTFKDWDGTQLSQQTVEYGKAAATPTDPERTGYTFSGWNKNISTITSDLIVTAQYTINTYTVTFEDYDGTELKKETVEYGNAAIAPADPSRIGYTFTGWNTDFSNVTSNLTITAQYTLASSIVEKEGKNNGIKVYPNPAKNLLTIDAGDLYLKDGITIVNITGCTVLQINNTAKQTIDISNLPCGIYFVKAGSIIKKFVKK